MRYNFTSGSWKLFVLILICNLIAGCASVAPTVQSAQSDAEPKKITLTVWHDWAAQDSASDIMRELLSQFQKDNPQIELRLQSVIPDVYRSRIKTIAAADELPDVFLIGPDSMTREFVRGGLIQPIDDLLKANSDWANGFEPRSFDAFTVEDKKYSVPMTISPTSLVFYNQAIFDQYRVPVPQTWEELLQAISTFNKHGVTPIALGNKSTWVAPSSIFSTLADRITGTDWFMNVVSQSGARFTDASFMDALAKMQQLARARAFQDNFGFIDSNQMEQMYFHKQAAMFIEGGWAVGRLIAEAPKDVLESTHITVLPAIPGGKGEQMATSGVVGKGFALNAKLEGERRDAALKLIYTMASPEAQRKMLNGNMLVSYRVDVDRTAAHPLFIELHDFMKRVKLLPAYETQLTTAAVETLNEGIQELLKGGSPAAIAQKLQDTQANVLGKFR
ncbi:extracellular solute-binding protein [Paenibacillus aceris]|uniref:Raffinose/stachyose/melibiose transport system substrate-binding protein n=1 Tax=Paenibacillus aceris TaxID=869555 RepID=A0ABS4HXT3_9BACL|nr:extracellular solute-binding protein [Paenibacillus aceris]MBP1963146.1 raffinose/stachyose/melibiose transport system substrate-binding protein [Paenibacillus aceris]NHW38735.1 extracellular solute-binding protein [Paenibacillus aceris]